jgi:hypothetical protein
MSVFEITSDDIVRWADRYEAAAVLPKLARRLVHATAVVKSLSFPGDAGVRLAGFDGIAESETGAPFVPAGLSVWELSTERNVLTKIRKDFKKRSLAYDGRDRAVYVAVTARRAAGKHEWAAEQRGDTGWADIRVVDADDLATWLEQAPMVAAWFAREHLGRPIDEAMSVEARSEAWRHRTKPPLSSDVLLLGTSRRSAAAQLLEWAKRSGGGHLVISAATREEAASFAATVLARDAEAAATALVVDGRRAWRWVVRQGHGRPPVIVLDAPEAEPSEATTNAKVIIPVDATSARTGDMQLGPVPWSRLPTLLREAGVEPGDAERVARESGGDLSVLQRLLGHHARSPWIDAAPFAELAALVLLGAWDPSRDADRGAVRELGVDAGSLDTTCARLARAVGEPVVSRADRWRSHWTFRSVTVSRIAHAAGAPITRTEGDEGRWGGRMTHESPGASRCRGSCQRS